MTCLAWHHPPPNLSCVSFQTAGIFVLMDFFNKKAFVLLPLRANMATTGTTTFYFKVPTHFHIYIFTFSITYWPWNRLSSSQFDLNGRELQCKQPLWWQLCNPTGNLCKQIKHRCSNMVQVVLLQFMKRKVSGCQIFQKYVSVALVHVGKFIRSSGAGLG